MSNASNWLDTRADEIDNVVAKNALAATENETDLAALRDDAVTLRVAAKSLLNAIDEGEITDPAEVAAIKAIAARHFDMAMRKDSQAGSKSAH